MDDGEDVSILTKPESLMQRPANRSDVDYSCFNPHQARKLDATEIYASMRKDFEDVSILTKPESLMQRSIILVKQPFEIVYNP